MRTANESDPESAIFGPAVSEDLTSLVAIDRGSQQPWTYSAFENELGNAPPTLFTLRLATDVIGFVVARFHPPEMDIVNLAVSDGRRRLGFGHILLKSLLERARLEGIHQVFLEVREGNQGARGLYRSLGFGETQRRRNFYKDPVEDAILMSLGLEP